MSDKPREVEIGFLYVDGAMLLTASDPVSKELIGYHVSHDKARVDKFIKAFKQQATKMAGYNGSVEKSKASVDRTLNTLFELGKRTREAQEQARRGMATKGIAKVVVNGESNGS